AEQNRPTTQRLRRLETLNAHKTPTLLSLQRGALAEFAADGRFPAAPHSAEVKILERVAVIEFKPGYVTLLYPQRRYRFETHRFDTKRRGAREYVLPKRHSVIGGAINIRPQLHRAAEGRQ